MRRSLLFFTLLFAIFPLVWAAILTPNSLFFMEGRGRISEGYILYKDLKNSSCSHDGMNGWNSTLRAAWYIRKVRWACLFCVSFIVWWLWTKYTIRQVAVDTQFHNFYGRSFARVLFFLVKVIGRWLPWMLPGQQDDFLCANHSECTDTM